MAKPSMHFAFYTGASLILWLQSAHIVCAQSGKVRLVNLPVALADAMENTRAEWDSVSLHFTTGEENTIEGPNEAFSSTRPPSGEWAASFGLSNRFANVRGERIDVEITGIKAPTGSISSIGSPTPTTTAKPLGRTWADCSNNWVIQTRYGQDKPI